MALLPERVNYETYRRDVHHQPLPFWQPALDHVAAKHGLPHDSWARARVMARALLYYPDDFVSLIRAVPGATGCGDWPAIAHCFWHLGSQ